MVNFSGKHRKVRPRMNYQLIALDLEDEEEN